MLNAAGILENLSGKISGGRMRDAAVAIAATVAGTGDLPACSAYLEVQLMSDFSYMYLLFLTYCTAVSFTVVLWRTENRNPLSCLRASRHRPCPNRFEILFPTCSAG